MACLSSFSFGCWMQIWRAVHQFSCGAIAPPKHLRIFAYKLYRWAIFSAVSSQKNQYYFDRRQQSIGIPIITDTTPIYTYITYVSSLLLNHYLVCPLCDNCYLNKLSLGMLGYDECDEATRIMDQKQRIGWKYAAYVCGVNLFAERFIWQGP